MIPKDSSKPNSHTWTVKRGREDNLISKEYWNKDEQKVCLPYPLFKVIFSYFVPASAFSLYFLSNFFQSVNSSTVNL